MHSLVWEEAQLLGGLDPDFHRRDLYDAIESGAYPSWDLGIQAFPDTPNVFGARVKAVDLDGDKQAEILTGPGPGTRPQVRTFTADLTAIATASAYEDSFLGGVYLG